MKAELNSWKLGFLVGIGALSLFLFYQAQGIYGGDSGDLVTAAVVFGVPHPPGYPLWTFLSWLATKLPLFTASWRVTLVSSVSHALTAVLVYLLTWRLTKRVLAAILAAILLIGNYVFFLYSVTPEVFGLLSLFVVLLTYLMLLWGETGEVRWLYAASFVFGLSLTHHHLIVFLLPGLAYWVWIHRAKLKAKKLKFNQTIAACSGLFLLGLLPYVYVPLAARTGSIVNWDNAVNLDNFIRLVTRADYGTFKSGGFYGTLLSQRLAEVKAYFQFLWLDFFGVGTLFLVTGLVWLWRHNRRYLYFLLLMVFSVGPLFLFYASFPLSFRFTLGTYERFLLPSYVLLYPVIGVGAMAVVNWLTAVLRRRLVALPARAWRGGLMLVLLIYPMTLLGITLVRFQGLPQDRTAENLGRDILGSVSEGSILLLGNDTPLFITQYVRYGLGERKDVILLHQTRLMTGEYPTTVTRLFPQITVPQERGEAMLPALAKANIARFPIFTNLPFVMGPDWFWIPQGLVYRLVSQNNLPAASETIATNTLLWQNYHNPVAGILGRYNHLMLSDIRDVYAAAKIEFGKFLVKTNEVELAKAQFEQAVDLAGDSRLVDAYTYLGLTRLFLKDCAGALTAFESARQTSFAPSRELKLYEALTYRDCQGDAQMGQALMNDYEAAKQAEQTPLEEL